MRRKTESEFIKNIKAGKKGSYFANERVSTMAQVNDARKVARDEFYFELAKRLKDFDGGMVMLMLSKHDDEGRYVGSTQLSGGVDAAEDVMHFAFELYSASESLKQNLRDELGDAAFADMALKLAGKLADSGTKRGRKAKK